MSFSSVQMVYLIGGSSPNSNKYTNTGKGGFFSGYIYRHTSANYPQFKADGKNMAAWYWTKDSFATNFDQSCYFIIPFTDNLEIILNDPDGYQTQIVGTIAYF